MKQETIHLQDRKITVETGEIARQANGSVIIKQGDTVLLVTAVAEEEAKEGMGFFPLTVEYRERMAAAGRIPSGFIKRENRPQDSEVLTSRLIDRSIRPLFPDNFLCETQVMVAVLSYDPDSSLEALAIMGASAALTLSNIPWNGPVAGVNLVQRGGKFTIMPTAKERENADLEMVVSCSKDGLVMVEGLGREVPDEEVFKVFQFVQDSLAPFFETIEKMQKELNIEKREAPPAKTYIEGLEKDVEQKASDLFLKVIAAGSDKKTRRKQFREAGENILAQLLEKYPENEGDIKEIMGHLKHRLVRDFMVKEQKRLDGRNFEEIRDISGKTGWLPRVHGSSLFTRGETQAMVSCTLGITEDEQIVDSITGEAKQKFYLHYNFPPYSVGEIRPLRGPGRREIGHGNLASRALSYTVPPHKKFPYTIRLVSDITESNGSSSMASVCGGCLAMMDAGVPIKKPVAGVAMGLISEGDVMIVLSDIMGDEDHLGDMDFKVAGTEQGVTAVQMDNKLGSLPADIMQKALEQALSARLHILKEMKKIQAEPREQLAPFAPRVAALVIRKERIRDLIGPGGKIIQGIQEKYSVRIDVNQDGWVRIYSPDEQSCKKAFEEVRYNTADLEVGKYYRGKVVAAKNFGAFVRIFAHTEGLVHISELCKERVNKVEDIVKEGDTIVVKVLGIDHQGKIRLSRKEVLDANESEIL